MWEQEIYANWHVTEVNIRKLTLSLLLTNGTEAAWFLRQGSLQTDPEVENCGWKADWGELGDNIYRNVKSQDWARGEVIALSWSYRKLWSWDGLPDLTQIEARQILAFVPFHQAAIGLQCTWERTWPWARQWPSAVGSAWWGVHLSAEGWVHQSLEENWAEHLGFTVSVFCYKINCNEEISIQGPTVTD